MEPNYTEIRSRLEELERTIASLDDEGFRRLSDELDRVRRAIKRRSRAMSLPISRTTLSAAHRHCSHKGIDMTQWVDQAVSAALDREGAGDREARKAAKRQAKLARKSGRHLVKADAYLAMPAGGAGAR